MNIFICRYRGIAKIIGMLWLWCLLRPIEEKFKNQLGKQKNKMWFPGKELHCLCFLKSLNYNENFYSNIFLYKSVPDLNFAFLSAVHHDITSEDHTFANNGALLFFL